MSFVSTVLIIIILIFVLILGFYLLGYLEDNSPFVYRLLNPKLAKVRDLNELVGTDKCTPYFQNILAKNGLSFKDGEKIVKQVRYVIMHSKDARNLSITYELNKWTEFQVYERKQYIESCNQELKRNKAKRLKKKKKNAKKNKGNQRTRNVSLSVRTKVFERDHYTCRMCGRNVKDDGVKLEVDHIMPVAKGGSDDISNLQTLCFECNRGKSDKILHNQLNR